MNQLHATTFSPYDNLNIIDCKKNCLEKNRYIYKRIENVGGGKKSIWDKFSPLINNIIKVAKGLILIIIIIFATMDIYQTLSCKEQYIRIHSKFASQYIIFLVIFLLIFILSTESINPMMAKAINFWKMFLGAIIVWILFNIISQSGDTWFSFSSPFWFGPLTFWTVILLLMCILYILDIINTILAIS